MPIYKNNKKVSAIYRGGTPISRIYKGETIVFDMVKPFSFNLLYSLPWYEMEDANRNNFSCTEIISKETVSGNVYQYTTASKCDNSYCITNTDSNNTCYAQLPLKQGFDLTNARSIIFSYNYDNVEENFTPMQNTATLFNFMYEDTYQFKYTFLYDSVDEYSRLYYTSGSIVELSDQGFTLENLNKTSYIVININGTVKTFSLYDVNANLLATMDYTPLNVNFGTSQGYIGAYCPTMGGIHIKHMSIIDQPITDGKQLKQIDEYVDSLKPSSNSFKGKFATSGDKTIKVNNTNYIINTDSDGNFNQEYSGDDITGINFNSVDIQELTQLPDMSNVTNMNNMFYNCRSLTSLDLSNFDTYNVISMTYMFYGCSGLTSLDLSGWDTSKVTNMSYMFYRCRSLTSLNVTNFDTSKVNNMNSMFRSCYSLTSLDVSNFNTSNVTYMNNMFYECRSLTSLDVSDWNTSKVTNMSGMFDECSSLTSLDLSGWDTSKVTNMSYMFENCYSLTSLDVSNFNTSNVTNMRQMFYKCSGLTSLDLSNFNTSNVTNMFGMFQGCNILTSLNLTNLDVSNVTDMSFMFENCTSLQQITCSQATKDKLMTLNTSSFPTKNTVQWTIV